MTGYIDPNSGAAPQPGGYAAGNGEGHAVPTTNSDAALIAAEYTAREVAVEPEAEVEEQQEVTEEIESEETTTTEEAGESDEDEPDSEVEDNGAAEAYDPGAYTNDEVLAYVAEYPDSKDAVLAAEQSGKNRKGIVDALSE